MQRKFKKSTAVSNFVAVFDSVISRGFSAIVDLV